MSERVASWTGITQTLKQISSRFPLGEDSAEEAQLYYRRACLAASEERYDVAMVFVGKALNLEPRHLPTRLLLAQIYDRGLHDIEAAIHGYKKVIALSGYDSSNPYGAAAREALDLLVTRAMLIPVEVPAGAGPR
jgi:tetratricopeptide (TPR) repeat protein